MNVEIIAEIGASHEGKLDTALRLAEGAARAGATVIKTQVGVDELAAETSALHDTFAELELPLEQWEKVAEECRNLGVKFSASCWSPRAVEWLASQKDIPWIKVGSGDANFEPMLEAAAGSGLPVYLSTGLCTTAEVDRAVQVLGPSLRCLLACTVEYPSAAHNANLSRLRRLRAFGAPLVGFSSHCRDWRVPFYATQLGAAVIEVHFATNLDVGQAQGALFPHELAQLASTINDSPGHSLPAAFRFSALGGSDLGVLECEKSWVDLARRDQAVGMRA